METEIAVSELLSEILSELRSQRVEPLWSTQEIGAFFSVSAKHACQIASAPGFPEPVDAPGTGRRWPADEVRAWARSNRRKTSTLGARRSRSL